MDSSNTRPPKTRTFNTMRAKGLGLVALGFAMLSLPLFAGGAPMRVVYAGALRPAGWFALVAGVVLLGIHHVRSGKRSGAKTAILPQSEHVAPASTGEPTLRDIRAELQKRQAEKH